MTASDRLNESLEPYAPLVEEYRRRAASQPSEEVLRWCRGLSDLELEMVAQREQLDALEVGVDERSTAAVLERWATRLDMLADALDARRTAADEEMASFFNDDETFGTPFRELAANLRRAPEWRAESKAEYERSRPSARSMEAMAVAENCWRDEPVEVRLQRINEAQRRLGALSEEARAEGNWDDVEAISEYATSVWRLREALAPTTGAEGS